MFEPSKVDPCIYLREYIICAVYVDDTIFWLPDEFKIEETVSELNAPKFELTDEEKADLFLGITINKDDTGNITMTQTVLIDTIIKAVGLKNDSKQH